MSATARARAASTVAKSAQESFGYVVREARERQGWSQEQLAEAAELNRSYLGEVERGAATPSLVTIIKLAVALGQTPAALLSRWETIAAD
ncbi:MAG: helix-turn-helix domain-containing protein [Solimonas sp.]